MSYILNSPRDFADESTEGFVSANANLVRRVPGGVARRGDIAQDEVAVVIGGGSGHYPAFAGLVGPGIAHGAAMGNVFASPSSAQIYSVAKSVATDAGVLFAYGNYAGDALNFDLAQERLVAEGIPCRTVRVTDDIYSADINDIAKRRGIAGDLCVFRAAGWAASRGLDLDTVTTVTARANDRTRSLGVAFSGATLPGADQPLFTVPGGQMAVGLGIHGEPGIETRALPSADELGALLVAGLLGEVPDGVGEVRGSRVGLVLNGLGSVKAEELFIVYRAVARELTVSGVEIVDPDVGEFATSFEMAGLSLTLFWLDDELEAAWTSPAYTPAYRKGTVTILAESIADNAADDAIPAVIEAASEGAAASGQLAARAIAAIRHLIDREVDALGRLDAIAGDGDHGIGMQRGATAGSEAAAAAAAQGAGTGTVCIVAGDAWAHHAGGTSGALWGAALRALGETIGDGESPTAISLAEGVGAARDAIQGLGKAKVGDKTLVDALVPFSDILLARARDGAHLALAWSDAAVAATEAAIATADLSPKMGRARPHAEKSVGTPDPGAISLALAVSEVANLLADAHEEVIQRKETTWLSSGESS